jgi:hypothetical protein
MIQAIDACKPLSVPVEIMAAVVQVESAGNPYAIGVVNGSLRRQPRNLIEAQQTVSLLNQQGYNYSIGAAQINKTNFRAYAIDPQTSGFDFCSSVKAGAKILAECYERSNNDWLKAFSCYYSGNFSTGFKQGYVKKVAHVFLQNNSNKSSTKNYDKNSIEFVEVSVNTNNTLLEKGKGSLYDKEKISISNNTFLKKSSLNEITNDIKNADIAFVF